jgi:hypothetical protein
MSAVQKIEPRQEITPARSVTPMEMLAQAIDKGASLDIVDKFMDMAERWEKNNQRKAFSAAISAAKSEIPIVGKNANGHNNKKFADFANIARTVDPILTRYGLGYRFRTKQDDKLIHVTCVLFHKDGHEEENSLAGPADASGSKNAIQAIGSTQTYLMRYTLTQALGIATSEDDDGRSAGNSKAIGAAEAANIRDIITALGDERVEPRLLTWLKVESIDAIPATRYDEAIERLKLVPPKGKQS